MKVSSSFQKTLIYRGLTFTDDIYQLATRKMHLWQHSPHPEGSQGVWYTYDVVVRSNMNSNEGEVQHELDANHPARSVSFLQNA